MRLIAEHPDVHAVVYLGIGIQSNQARMMRDGPFFPGYGLERIVDYHERQDARFAEAADELSRATGKPILTATELAVADPANAGPATVRATRPAVLPERQPRRHRPRPPLPRRPAPGPSRRVIGATARRRQPGRRPDRPGADPGARCCSALWRWADGQRRGLRPAAVVARRAAGAVAGAGDAAAVVPADAGRARPRRQPRGRSGRRSTAFGATLADPSCVAVAVDGVDVGGDARPTCR